MPISTTCPNCKAIFRLADELAGKKVKCQKCESLFVVPTGVAGTMVPGARLPEEPKKTPIESSPAQAEPTRPAEIPVTSQLAEKNQVDRQDDDDRRTPARPRRSERRPRYDESPKTRSVLLPILLALAGLGIFACVVVIAGSVIWQLAEDERPQPQFGGRNRNPGFARKNFEAKGVRGGFNQLPIRPINQNPATEIKLGADGLFHQESELTLQDPPNPDNKRHKHYAIHLEEGKRYQIDLESIHFDAFLFLLDDANNIVAENDDIEEVVNQNSRIVYLCPRTATYKIEATFFANPDGRELGPFTLIVRELK
jgi:predicted Zn finger-like uncharacterized protein